MSRITNEDRIERARRTLEFYKGECLEECGPVDQDTLADLLTDILHLAHKHDETWPLDLGAALPMAALHYEAESKLTCKPLVKVLLAESHYASLAKANLPMTLYEISEDEDEEGRNSDPQVFTFLETRCTGTVTEVAADPDTVDKAESALATKS